jgi:hypothetical protein
MTVRRFYIVMAVDTKDRPHSCLTRPHPYLIIEKMVTVDGMRDRITSRSFATLIEAQEFVDSKNVEVNP